MSARPSTTPGHIVGAGRVTLSRPDGGAGPDWGAYALLSVLVVMPKLDPTRSNGFSRWARCTDPDAIRQALADDVRPARLHALSVLCERKMCFLQWAARLALVAVLAISAAALLSAAV
ncbi:hypothetical protein ABZW30_13185 [Kitasatospora sp. NPDC004669]|uniref:hypothetical protein n=1 Tax=Kitasatospora sp. NPDC004669 TaxID=3154555 RepID=UPI0033A987ED